MLGVILFCIICLFFFYNVPSTTDVYTLSLHDALPICANAIARLLPGILGAAAVIFRDRRGRAEDAWEQDRKSTRLNSSHSQNSYAVFCLKKKKQNRQTTTPNRKQIYTDQTYPHY